MGTFNEDDETPTAAAWRELHRLTSPTPVALELERQGKSFVYSPSPGRKWTIYSFLFALKSHESTTHTTWDGKNWTWHNPFEVLNVNENSAFPNSALLLKSMGRVWFENDLGGAQGSAGYLLACGLKQLKYDHQSGARQLAGVALRILQDVARRLKVEPGREHLWWMQVRTAAWHIWKNGRESMGAAILNVLLHALRYIEDKLDTRPPDLLRDAAVAGLEQRITKRAAPPSIVPVSDALLGYIETHFPKSEPTGVSSSTTPVDTKLSILTLSESSTISQSLQQILLRSHFTEIDIRILESRPLFEGVSLAASLVRHAQSQSQSQPEPAASRQRPPTKVSINIFTDASAAMAARGVDVVLLGADRIASTGAVSNKTGSLPAVLGAKQSNRNSGTTPGRHGAHVVVMSETEKIATPGNPHAHIVEQIDPAQLSRDWHSSFNSQRVRDAAAFLDDVATASRGQTDPIVQIRTHNVFFEWVPPELVDAYITEKGIWTLEDINRHSEALGREEERIFGGL